jgi:sec-independent protein translocase protein TatA
MGPFGVQEMIAVFVIALVLFGPKKLPELGRTLGKALTEFRRAKNELKATFESHLNEIERETRIDTGLSSTTSTPYSPAPYSYPYDEYGQYDSGQETFPESNQTQGAVTHETPQLSTASATATQDAEAHRDASSQNAPVSGTVARSNGAQPLDFSPAHLPEERPV